MMHGAWLLGVLLAGACRQTSGGSTTGAAHEVRYVLDWAWDDAARVAPEPAWEVTNDLGYRVRVTRGWVTSYSMELVECPQEAVPPGTFLWSVDGVAWAGHAAGTPNPAAIRPMQVESLTEPAARQVGAVRLAPQTYCQLHYLVARAGREALGLPTELDMVDISLHVDGTYQRAGTPGAIPFTLHTAVANGGLFDRPAGSRAAMHVDTAAGGTRVTVRRHLGRIFDGVDFATMPVHQAATQVLKALIDHVEVEIDVIRGHA